jgi:hypothetical protein
MPGKQKAGWYGVKTLLRIVAGGEPRNADAGYDASSTLLEERVVLFRAGSFADAIAQAEAEIAEYCAATRLVNVYGQRVRAKYLGVADAFELFDSKVAAGCEV